jgi:hypothetical protein
VLAVLAAAGFAGAWAVGGQAGNLAATTLPNPDPPPTRPVTPPPPPAPPPPPPPAAVTPPPPPPPAQTYVAPPPPPASVRPTPKPKKPKPKKPKPDAPPARPRQTPHAPTAPHLRQSLTPPSRRVAAYPVALGPSTEPNRLLPVVLLSLVLLVPLTALALVVAPTQRLPDRTAAVIEQRRETLMALGLVGILGIAIGIGIALVGL